MTRGRPRPGALPALAALLACALSCGRAATSSKPAAQAGAGQTAGGAQAGAAAGPLSPRSATVVSPAFDEPALAASPDGQSVWLASYLAEPPLRLSRRDREGRVVLDLTPGGLELRQGASGIAATSAGPIVYGNSNSAHGWFAYVRRFDQQGHPGALRVFQGALSMDQVVAGADGELTLLVSVRGTVDFGGQRVIGPPVASPLRSMPVVVRLDAAGKLCWLRHLPYRARGFALSFGLAAAADGRIAILRTSLPRPGDGPAVEIWDADGKPVWSSGDLMVAEHAAFRSDGTLIAVGTTAPLSERALQQSLPDSVVLDVYGHGQRHSRTRLCMRCGSAAGLGVDAEGRVVLLVRVGGAFDFGGVALTPADAEGEDWLLLQLQDGRLRAHHRLRTTHARLAVGGGNVAVVAQGVRGITALDGREVAAYNASVLLQFDP